MHIAFKFHYTHPNGLFARLLQEIRNESPSALSMYAMKDVYVIEASGEQNELEAVAELISSRVPRSLFLKEYTVESVEIPHPLSHAMEYHNHYRIPCCPQCTQKMLQHLDPFVPCRVCGFSDTSLGWKELDPLTPLEGHASDTFFGQLVDTLLQEESIVLPTYNGLRRFSLLKSKEHANEGILICDPSNLSASWLVTPNELESLMMIEKPSIRLKPKLRFRAQYDLANPFYPVFFADDTVTMAFSIALSRKGIEALYCDNIPSLRVVSALDKHIVVTIGRDTVPWYYPLVFDTSVCCSFEKFHALGTARGIYLETKTPSYDVSCVPFVAKGEYSSIPHAVTFEPAHAALRSIVLEKDLQGESLCGIYVSRHHRSQICSFSPKIGYTSMVDFWEDTLTQPNTMFESISQMDDAGERLIANFQKTFPAHYAKIVQACFDGADDASMITKLWAMASLVIGLCDGGDIQRACEQLEAAALEFSGKSGPRIDYKVTKTKIGYQLDPRWAIRSAMSFKLAGVDEYLLSYGFIDSLADFIAKQSELADANISIKGVALSGSLFENRQLFTCTHNALHKNYPIYYNEILGMDGANVAVGAVSLGRE